MDDEDQTKLGKAVKTAKKKFEENLTEEELDEWIEYEEGEWGVRAPTYYMDSVGSIYDRWQILDYPWKHSDGTILNGGYLQLIDLFAKEYDPTIAVISGMIYKNDTAD